jgi:hypothetical protein
VEDDVPRVYKKADDTKRMVNQILVIDGTKLSLAQMIANKVK